MLKKINPEKTNAWNELQKHYETMQLASMKEMFAKDSLRFDKYSLIF